MIWEVNRTEPRECEAAMSYHWARCGCAQCEKTRRLDAATASYGAWRPIETAPRDEEVFFWLVPKRPEEAYLDTSGNPIVSGHRPYLHRGRVNSWPALSKATHWMPLPPAPHSTDKEVAS